MNNPHAEQTGVIIEWVAKSARLRALATALESKARTNPEVADEALRHAAKLRRGALALEILESSRASMEDGKPSFQAPNESPTDALPSAKGPSP